MMTVMSLMMTVMITLVTTGRAEEVTKHTMFGCNQDSVHLHCPPGAGVNIIR